MKKIFESKYYTIDGEDAEKVYVFKLDNDDEYWQLSNMSFEEKCEYFDVHYISSFGVAPGNVYYSYVFDIGLNHAVMYERTSYNV